ncbi:L,D-transpeptidase [Niallia sp. NCCP-28]|uniref:L,D-transpeptidase n=1 Tax=Niallia sp. NCCP-28 TaxID=2934712 RepID=UPI00208BD548|nr:L,D-transpeptidase [Niallia sp. NCCP-28]GKU80662.1 putative L,D-transpeptidase YciB [Niallia sp. NCCP-28]
MKNASKYSFFLLLLIIVASLVGCSSNSLIANTSEKEKNTPDNEKTVLDDKESKEIIKEKTADQADEEKEAVRKEIDWNNPSNGTYPDIKNAQSLWIDVSVDDQKVYIKNENTILYTMVASTGLDTNPDNSTPKGTYYIEPERGEWFFSSGYKEGAEYWVSWKNHGEFLFHSVPMDENKQVIKAEAEKLGEKASHGCIRLTVSDAKWIYDNIQTNTKVVIRS